MRNQIVSNLLNIVVILKFGWSDTWMTSLIIACLLCKFIDRIICWKLSPKKICSHSSFI
jgi:hypothetical protein